MGHWLRGRSSNLDWGRHNILMASLQPGDTVQRVIAGVQGDGFITNPGSGGQTFIRGTLANFLAWGVCTTVGNGTEVPPSPVTSPTDAAPPTQRWLYLATAAMSLTALSGSSSTYPCRLATEWFSTQTEGQVLATGFASPTTLNVWLVLDTYSGAWEGSTPTDIAWMLAWWSLLRKM